MLVARMVGYATPYDMFKVSEVDKKDLKVIFGK